MRAMAGLILNRSPRSKSHLKIPDFPSILFSGQIMVRAGMLLKKVNSKSGSSSIDLCLCTASNCAFSSQSVNKLKNSPFDGHQQTAGDERDRAPSSRISARQAPAVVEDYGVDLDGVSTLELAIKPDLTRREAPPILASWRVA